MCVCVCAWSQSKREYCLGVYSVLLRQTVSGAGPVAMLHFRCITLLTHVASYPNAGCKWEHTIGLQCAWRLDAFPQFGRDSRNLGKWVPHVWIEIWLYIPMGLTECFGSPRNWTFYRIKSIRTCTEAPDSPHFVIPAFLERVEAAVVAVRRKAVALTGRKGKIW